MGVRARIRGEKEPTGKTKSTILLFLADKGESTFTEIRNYLKDACNIRSSKDVRLHLEDLASDEKLALVDKISHGNGNANSYRIRRGFNSLKRLHNYLNKHGSVPELMNTRYFMEYTVSTDFMTKVRTNINRNMTLSLYEYIIDDEKYSGLKRLLEYIDYEDRLALFSWMDRIREGDRNEAHSSSFLLTLDTMRSGDIDRLGDMFIDLSRMMGMMETKEIADHFRMLMFELDLPSPQREALFTILKYSPGAFDYMLNSTSSNPLFPPNPYPAYVLILAISRVRSGLKAMPDEGIGRWAGYSLKLPRLSAEPPMLVIARSLFVADMVKGGLAIDDIPEETLRLIFGKN
jgi:hypothetical protein